MKILLTNTYAEEPLRILQRQVPEGFRLVMPEKATKKDLLSKVDDADVLLVSGRVRIDEEVVQEAKKLKMVQRTGVGTDTLALDALSRRKIPVYVNRGINSTSVAEHTVMMMLAMLKNLTAIDSSVKKGIWKKQETGVRNHTLHGKTVGFIGMGNIGMEVSKRLKFFGAEMIYFDIKRLRSDIERQYGLCYSALDEVLMKSDIITIHCALNPSTYHLLGKDELEMMKQGVIIINTSRGGIIDEESLVEALKSKKIAGCGLDVFESEPIREEHPILKMKNVILTPHIGGVTFESFSEMMERAIYNIKMFCEGKRELIEESRLI